MAAVAKLCFEHEEVNASPLQMRERWSTRDTPEKKNKRTKKGPQDVYV